MEIIISAVKSKFFRAKLVCTKIISNIFVINDDPVKHISKITMIDVFGGLIKCKLNTANNILLKTIVALEMSEG